MENMNPASETSQHSQPVVVEDSQSSPAIAFEQYVEMFRRSSAVEPNVRPDDILALLRPFIINPGRFEAAVRAIVLGYAGLMAIQTFELSLGKWKLRKFYRWFLWGPTRRLLTQTNEQAFPDHMTRLRTLEAMLKTDLRPGSLVLKLKPIQYLDTPAGYSSKLCRYRLGVQTLVEPAEEDSLNAVSIELTVAADPGEVTIDVISPQPGFSAVGLKASRGFQAGAKETHSTAVGASLEISGAGIKATNKVDASHSQEVSRLYSMGAEQSLARVEQYLISRKAGNRAFWRALAGVGPIDVGGIEYIAELLISRNIREISITVEATVEWARGGAVPTTLRQLLPLPTSPA